jgi:AhpD family alkylhydroperoxidase
MEERLYIEQVAPDALKAVLGLEKYVRANVDNKILELVKLRASFVNQCTWCVDSHSQDALKAGETTRRLFSVGAWHEAPWFTAKERSALALTDAITRIADGGVPDEVWQEATEHWSEKELADLVVAAATINVWNRLNIATRRAPADVA